MRPFPRFCAPICAPRENWPRGTARAQILTYGHVWSIEVKYCRKSLHCKVFFDSAYGSAMAALEPWFFLYTGEVQGSIPCAPTIPLLASIRTTTVVASVAPPPPKPAGCVRDNRRGA